jgi:aminoglycoside/choline kinase family phosphotransferase
MSRGAGKDRAGLAAEFIAAAGWGAAQRGFLAGDASARSYDRLRLGGRSVVFMDAPPDKGEDIHPFVTMAGHLRSLGLSAPEIFASDQANGFLLLEDLGDDLFARHLECNPSAETGLYSAAIDVLACLQSAPPPPDLPAHSHAFMAGAAGLAIEWYDFALRDTRADPSDIVQATAEALVAHCSAVPVLVLRDYHAENLLWLPGRGGLARVGLLDFQMGSLGQGEYDLISLLQDARRDVSPGLVGPMQERFAAATGRSLDQTRTACAVLGAQRALRILGAFARLSLRFGKPGYVRLVPRVWAQLQSNLDHPALAGLRQVVARSLLPPTPDALERIIRKCGTAQTL